MKNTKIVAFANQKGGVSKTSSCMNVCYSLANTYRLKTLLIDFDAQASASIQLGCNVFSGEVNTVDKLLEPMVSQKVKGATWEAVQRCIYSPTYQDRIRDPENKMQWKTVDKPFGFDIMPSSLYLSVVELYMGLVSGALRNGAYQYYLTEVCRCICENADYDMICIDTSPSLGPTVLNAMMAAKDGIIAVSNADVMSLRGIGSFIETVQTIKNIKEDHRGILGILLSLYSDRRIVDRSIDEWVKEFLPIPTFDTRIPESSDVKKANSSMLLVSQINKKIAKAFDELTREIIYAVNYPDEPVGSAKGYMEVTEDAEH